MHGEIAPFPMDAPESYRVYSELRNGVGPQAASLGDGRNCFSPGGPLVRWLGQLFASEDFAVAASTYEEPRGARQVIAAAMSVALDVPDLTADDVYLTAGATEAVSVGFQAARADGCTQVMLPLPGYFGFELSAMRWGISVAGYIRPDTPPREHMGGTDIAQFDGLLVDVVPNGVSGLFPASAEKTHSTASLSVVDCIYCVHGLDPDLLSRLAMHLHAYALDKSLWAFTASKDLGLPGMRAGFLLTRTPSVKLAASQHRLEINYTPSIVQSHIAVLYALILAAERIRGDRGVSANVAVEHAWGAIVEATEGIAALDYFPPTETLVNTVDELDALTDRCLANWQLVEDWSHGVGAKLTPSIGGYSVLMKLPNSTVGQHDLVEWVNEVGRLHDLKLNPSVLYGGNVSWWRELYGTEWYIRLNLSNAPAYLLSALDVLSRALAI